MAKKLSDYIPILKDQGIDYIAAAPAAGVSTQYKIVDFSSGTPQVIELDHEMADTNYAVTACTDTATPIAVGFTGWPDLTEGKTVSAFAADDMGAGGIVNFIIVGQLKGQK